MIYPHRDLQAYSQRVLLGVLQDRGFSVHLLFVSGTEGIQKDDKIRDHFLRLIERSKIIGFGFMSNGYPSAEYLTKLIKANFSKPVIWGGPHSTINYRNMSGHADAIFVGEAEVVLQKYVEATINNKDFSRLPQIVNGEDDFIPANKDFFIKELDELPLPFYSNSDQSLITPDHFINSPDYFRSHFRDFHIMTSRGCPYSCSYCANSYLNNFIPDGIKHFRKRSEDYVIREIKHCQRAYSLSSIAIEDDLFLARSNEELELFVERYNKEINLPIGITGITPSFFHKDKIKIISRLPLIHLRIGIQTLSAAGLEAYRRKTINKELDNCIDHVKKLNKKGILFCYDVILDNPYESVRDNIKTLRYVSRLPKPFQLLLYHLTLYEGTELRNRAISDGFIDINDLAYIQRPYTQLNNTYINTLFRLIESTYGLVPAGLIYLLSSPSVLNHECLQKPIKKVIDIAITLLNKISLQTYIWRYLGFKRRLYK